MVWARLDNKYLFQVGCMYVCMHVCMYVNCRYLHGVVEAPSESAAARNIHRVNIVHVREEQVVCHTYTHTRTHKLGQRG